MMRCTFKRRPKITLSVSTALVTELIGYSNFSVRTKGSWAPSYTLSEPFFGLPFKLVLKTVIESIESQGDAQPSFPIVDLDI